MEVTSDAGLQLYSSRCKRDSYAVEKEFLYKGATFKW
jgi:hypothetical protein